VVLTSAVIPKGTLAEVPFLRKPFTGDQLSQVIIAALT
jgi:hypothetical protein